VKAPIRYGSSHRGVACVRAAVCAAALLIATLGAQRALSKTELSRGTISFIK